MAEICRGCGFDIAGVNGVERICHGCEHHYVNWKGLSCGVCNCKVSAMQYIKDCPHPQGPHWWWQSIFGGG